MESWLRSIFCVVMFGIVLCVFACSDEDMAENTDTEETTDRYYVKYCCSGGSVQEIRVATPEGEVTYSNNGYHITLNQTFGPVSKGFKCSITASPYPVNVEIYVCRGEEPFVIKATGSKSASYVIDF